MAPIPTRGTSTRPLHCNRYIIKEIVLHLDYAFKKKHNYLIIVLLVNADQLPSSHTSLAIILCYCEPVKIVCFILSGIFVFL